MAEKTIVEKAAEKVGFGLAMAEDVAGSVKTAVDAAVTKVTKALKKSPAKKSPAKKTAKKDAAKKTPAKKAAKNVIKKVPAKKAAKKSVKKAANKAGRLRR
jgi:hypothetical protein